MRQSSTRQDPTVGEGGTVLVAAGRGLRVHLRPQQRLTDVGQQGAGEAYRMQVCDCGFIGAADLTDKRWQP